MYYLLPDSSAFLIIFLFPLSVYAQTEKIELDYLNSLIGTIPRTELNEKAAKWREILKEFGGYPELP